MPKNINKNTVLEIAIYTFCISGIVGENVFDYNFCFLSKFGFISCVDLLWLALLNNVSTVCCFCVTHINFKMFHMDFHFVFFPLFYNPQKYIYLHCNCLHSIATDAVSKDKLQKTN